jgi:hypothetical protein
MPAWTTMRTWTLLGLLAATTTAATTAGGCAAHPGGAPAGPGAATETDLAPWLADAPTVTYTGELMYFHCTSENGNYWTWSIGPAGPDDAAELDIRRCTADAQRLWQQQVTVTGKLICRGVRHFPLLVADSIKPAEPETMLVSR